MASFCGGWVGRLFRRAGWLLRNALCVINGTCEGGRRRLRTNILSELRRRRPEHKVTALCGLHRLRGRGGRAWNAAPSTSVVAAAIRFAANRCSSDWTVRSFSSFNTDSPTESNSSSEPVDSVSAERHETFLRRPRPRRFIPSPTICSSRLSACLCWPTRREFPTGIWFLRKRKRVRPHHQVQRE